VTRPVVLGPLPPVAVDSELGERLLTPEEVAGFLGVSRDTVLDLAQGRGQLRLACVRVNSRVVRFLPDDVRTFVASQRQANPARLRDGLEVKRAKSPAGRGRVSGVA
jgi:predicted DNA-binding transcriptional regulator AlpA